MIRVSGFVFGRVVIFSSYFPFSLFPFYFFFLLLNCLYIWRRERSGWISSIDRKMIIVIFFFIYIYFLLFYSASFSVFPISAAAHSKILKNSFHQLNFRFWRFLSLLYSFQRPPSFSSFETRNDNFLSPYSSSFGFESTAPPLSC